MKPALLATRSLAPALANVHHSLAAGLGPQRVYNPHWPTRAIRAQNQACPGPGQTPVERTSTHPLRLRHIHVYAQVALPASTANDLHIKT